MNFIPANEKPLFIRLFRWYVKLLFKRRFANVWINQEYIPPANSRTIYFANHNSWWDGLTPLLLNEFVLHQNARAIMEDEQMKTYPFFKWIGAFSIDRGDTRKAIYTLRYALQSMQRENASLYIYPEGTIKPFIESLHPGFEGGLSWLITKLPDVDVVPLTFLQRLADYDKPELIIHIGRHIPIDRNLQQENICKLLEQTCGDNLRQASYINPASHPSYSKLV